MKNKNDMKDGTKNIIAACILMIGLIVAGFLYAFANRYEIDQRHPAQRFDKWTKKIEYMTKIN